MSTYHTAENSPVRQGWKKIHFRETPTRSVDGIRKGLIVLIQFTVFVSQPIPFEFKNPGLIGIYSAATLAVKFSDGRLLLLNSLISLLNLLQQRSGFLLLLFGLQAQFADIGLE